MEMFVFESFELKSCFKFNVVYVEKKRRNKMIGWLYIVSSSNVILFLWVNWSSILIKLLSIDNVMCNYFCFSLLL